MVAENVEYSQLESVSYFNLCHFDTRNLIHSVISFSQSTSHERQASKKSNQRNSKSIFDATLSPNFTVIHFDWNFLKAPNFLLILLKLTWLTLTSASSFRHFRCLLLPLTYHFPSRSHFITWWCHERLLTFHHHPPKIGGRSSVIFLEDITRSLLVILCHLCNGFWCVVMKPLRSFFDIHCDIISRFSCASARENEIRFCWMDRLWLKWLIHFSCFLLSNTNTHAHIDY